MLRDPDRLPALGGPPCVVPCFWLQVFFFLLTPPTPPRGPGQPHLDVQRPLLSNSVPDCLVSILLVFCSFSLLRLDSHLLFLLGVCWVLEPVGRCLFSALSILFRLSVFPRCDSSSGLVFFSSSALSSVSVSVRLGPLPALSPGSSLSSSAASNPEWGLSSGFTAFISDRLHVRVALCPCGSPAPCSS